MRLGVAFIIAAAAFAVAIVRRALIVERKREEYRRRDMPFEPKSSPIAEAIMQFGSTAGGIYVALVALTAFLGIELPDRVSFYGLTVEPLAAISFILAVLGSWLAPVEDQEAMAQGPAGSR